MAKRDVKKSGPSPTIVRFQRDIGKREERDEKVERFRRYVQEGHEKKRIKYTPAYRKEIDVENKTLVALASTGAIDRHREIIDPEGWDTNNFDELNPVILFAHDYRSPSIGRSMWSKKSKKGLVFKMEFADTPFGNELFYLYQHGFMNAFSVGFDPIEWVDADGKDGWYTTFKKQELLEISAVPVPANPEAVVLGADDELLRFRTVIKSAIKDSGMDFPAIREFFEEIDLDLEDEEDEIDDVTGKDTEDEGVEEEFENDEDEPEDGRVDNEEDAVKNLNDRFLELMDAISDMGSSVHESNQAMDIRIDGLEEQVENMLDLMAWVMQHVGLLKDAAEIEDELDLDIDDDPDIDVEQMKSVVSEMVRDTVEDTIGREFARLRGRMFRAS